MPDSKIKNLIAIENLLAEGLKVLASGLPGKGATIVNNAKFKLATYIKTEKKTIEIDRMNQLHKEDKGGGKANEGF